MARDVNAIKSYIRASLGGEEVFVELTDGVLNICIEEALEWLSTYIGNTKILYVPASPTYEYTMPDDCNEVVDVYFDSAGEFQYSFFRDVPLNYHNLVNGQYSSWGVGYTGLVQAMQYTEMAQNVTGATQKFTYNSYDKKLRIFPTTSVGNQNIGILYTINNVEVEKLPVEQYSLVKNYSYAHALEMLGNIRSKYSELPSSAGSITLNGDTLKSDAELKKGDLNEKIKNLQRPLPIITG